MWLGGCMMVDLYSLACQARRLPAGLWRIRCPSPPPPYPGIGIRCPSPLPHTPWPHPQHQANILSLRKHISTNTKMITNSLKFSVLKDHIQATRVTYWSIINLSYSEFFYQPPPRCCRSICLSPRGLTVSRTLAPCPHVVGPQCLTMMPFIIRSPLEHLHLSSGPTTPWTLVNSLSMYHIHFIKCHIWEREREREHKAMGMANNKEAKQQLVKEETKQSTVM